MDIEYKKLGEISTAINYGYTASATIKKIGPKFLRITDIQNDFIDWNSVPYCNISAKDFHKNKLAIGDIVIARTGNSTGSNAIVKKQVDAVFASYLIRFNINPNVADPFYVAYVLKSKYYFDFVNAIRGGSAQPGANARQFSSFKVPVLPIEEQHRIADILSSIDDKIELNMEMNKTLEEMAKAIYKEWFVDFGPFRDGEFVDSELGLIPKGWDCDFLGNRCTIVRGASPRPITDPKYFKNGTIPWIKISDATASKSIYINSTREYCTKLAVTKSRLLKAGSLILSNSATVGLPKILNIDGCIHDGWLAFSDFNVITRNYTYFTLIKNFKSLESIADGSVQKNLNTSILKQLKIIVPPNDITSSFDTIVQPLFDLILSNDNEISHLQKLRDYLLPKLISGKIRVKAVEEKLKEVL